MATGPPKPPQVPPQQVQVTVTWEGVEQHPAMAANAFILQQTGQEFILSLGFAALPYFRTQEEATAIKTVPAQVITRVSMTPGRVVELLGMLQQALAQYQAQQKQ